MKYIIPVLLLVLCYCSLTESQVTERDLIGGTYKMTFDSTLIDAFIPEDKNSEDEMFGADFLEGIMGSMLAAMNLEVKFEANNKAFSTGSLELIEQGQTEWEWWIRDGLLKLNEDTFKIKKLKRDRFQLKLGFDEVEITGYLTKIK